MSKTTVSIEAVAMRETSMRKHAEGDALLLQEQLIQAYARIKELENIIAAREGAENGDPA